MSVFSKKSFSVLQSSLRQNNKLFSSFDKKSSRCLFSTSSPSSDPTAPILTAAHTTSKYPQLALTLRTGMGSKNSQKLRNVAGLVPGVVYGKNIRGEVVKVMIAVDRLLLEREMRRRGAAFENTIYDVSLPDGTAFTVVPRQLQLNPLTDRPVNVNFLVYYPGMRLSIPIEYINIEDCVDLKKGAHLIIVNAAIECICEGEVPQKIYVDMTKLEAGAVVRLQDMPMPPLVRPAKNVPKNFVAGVLKIDK